MATGGPQDGRGGKSALVDEEREALCFLDSALNIDSLVVCADSCLSRTPAESHLPLLRPMSFSSAIGTVVFA